MQSGYRSRDGWRVERRDTTERMVFVTILKEKHEGEVKKEKGKNKKGKG